MVISKSLLLFKIFPFTSHFKIKLFAEERKKHTCFLSVPKLVYTISGYQREKKFKFTPHKLPDFSHFLDRSAKNICRVCCTLGNYIIVKTKNQITVTISYISGPPRLYIFLTCAITDIYQSKTIVENLLEHFLYTVYF